jgi:hypothetical protein
MDFKPIRQRVWVGEEPTKSGRKRKCTGGLFYDYRLSWPIFKTYIDDAINERSDSLKWVSIKSHHSQWMKIIVDGEGGGNPEWWSEFNSLLDVIENRFIKLIDVSKEKVTELHRLIESKVHLSKTKIKFGVFPCQDTILPLFFEQSYNRNLDVEFVIFKNWNEGLNAFKSKLNPIQVALHNFPTTVAYNSLIDSEYPLFFYPFFSFNGYGIFIKKDAIKKVAIQFGQSPYSTFSELYDDAKKELFETNKILVEKFTDFEWAVLSFCRSLDCDKSKVIANFENHNTNEAKNIFLKEGDNNFNIYCTNPLNIVDLIRNTNNDSIELIDHDKGLTEHHNFNGLICTIDFLSKNGDAVAEVISTWFNDIVRLNKELKNSNSFTGMGYSKILPELTDFLQKKIASNINNEDLIKIYNGHNTFYESPREAFNKFYYEVLTTGSNIFENNKEISLIQLGKEIDSDNKIETMMNLIKNHMSNL